MESPSTSSQSASVAASVAAASDLGGRGSEGGSESFEPSAKKRRIPKACASCRNSKLRCDGGKPCLRCREKNTWCDYVKPVVGFHNDNLMAQKLARLEAEISSLRSSQTQPQVHRPPEALAQTQARAQISAKDQQSPNPSTTAMMLLQMQAQAPTPPYPQPQTHTQTRTPNLASHELYQQFQDAHRGLGISTPTSSCHSEQYTNRNQSLHQPLHQARSHIQPQNQQQNQLPPFTSLPFQTSQPQSHSTLEQISEAAQPPAKRRKRAEFELNIEARGDAVSRGLISYEDAELYFKTFFEGCDRYVPVFDPNYDTFESVKARSSMLFDVICAVGCRAEHGPSTPPSNPQSLVQTTKPPLCAVILGTAPKGIETIQALLIDACYSEKGWLLTSMALKMALELDLPESYRKLSGMVLTGGPGDETARDGGGREEVKLMRESRVWFGVWVLEHILSIDSGKPPGVRAVSGEATRRCRVLLRHPAHTALDFRLLAQVELNSIRALAHERLLPVSRQNEGLSDEEMTEIVQGTRIDLSVWLSDWENLVESRIQNPDERATLIVNLKIQRDWSEMTMLCKGLQGMGIENVAIMSDPQRNLIHLAKNSAKRHLATILSQPEVYLASFRYSMDFVWAKCTFSVLLLLKLARIVPDPSPQNEMSSLIADSKTLLSHLAKIRGSSNIYLRILALSVEKCEKALNSDGMSAGSLGVQSNRIEGEDGEGVDPEMDFQSYVPREFTLEWNFPGLTFCWIPCDWMDLFADFGAGF